VEFTVRNTGAGGELNALDELVWRLEPDSVAYHPASSIKFAPPPVYDTVSAADSVWSRRIVHPGKIIVSGVSGPNTQEDTIMVSVTDREWDPPQVVHWFDSVNTTRPPDPADTATTWDGARFHPIGDGSARGSNGLPRTRGDGPVQLRLRGDAWEAPPHTRG
jgi:hypothetical protein